MAAALARRASGNMAVVESAGIGACRGTPAAANAITVMAEQGLVINDHMAHRVDDLDLSSFDLIVAMDHDVAQSLRERGASPERVVELDIEDPIGGDIDRYRATARMIATEIERLAATQLG